MNISETISNVRQWGLDKGITGAGGSGTLLGQLTKTQEELTETRDAAVILINTNCYWPLELIKDGIGDAAVTLILAAERAGTTFEECLETAYNEIKNRTGRAGTTFEECLETAYNEIKNRTGRAGATFEECLETAYNEIKNRTGRMIDGQFVKDKGQVISDTEYTEEVQDNA